MKLIISNMELKMIENYSSERRDNLEDMQPNTRMNLSKLQEF